MTAATRASNANAILRRATEGGLPTELEALSLADYDDTRSLADVAAALRDDGFLNLVTYSKKVFIPLTHLCRDVCHYCTFAQTPSKLDNPFMDLDAVLEVARRGAEMGCKEALFTLGEKPELRYRAAREWLAGHGYATTLEYLHDAAKAVFEQTGLLPHLNPGNMTPDEIATLRPVSPSMGIMLESASDRLTEKGMPHYGSPGQGTSRAAADARRRGTGQDSVHHRHPDRHWRDPPASASSRCWRFVVSTSATGTSRKSSCRTSAPSPARRCGMRRSRISTNCFGPSPSHASSSGRK